MEELEQYEKYWDIIRTQKCMLMDALKEGEKKGRLDIAKRLNTKAHTAGEIEFITGLSKEEIESL